MYLAIITLPLLGSVISGFFGRKVGVSGAQLVTCTCVIATTILAIIAFIEIVLNNTSMSVYIFRWLDSESLNVLWGFNFDSLTASMLIPVLIISSLVHIYSVGYMSHDPHNQRFFSYLSLFTFMMIVLVTANNFLLMFVGWEGVGVCSYLLVSFWFTRIAANQSSMSAFLTNRVGDCFLTLGMFTLLWTFGNLDYSTVFSLAPYINENAITIIGICLLIGAMAKSSQIGLHVWLPLAMEGPTPVSALIHAATMVTAGVYLLMRSSPLIEYSSTVLIACLWLGSVTTVFSSLIGLFQQDIKKVIAYSTMSQLGMMVIAVGLSSYNVALFHLVNHAFYKGLLFLGAGAVIHAVADNQDFRKYGGLLSFLPLTYTVMLIASLSLVAFPFMTGFYSKDFILESAFGQFKYSGLAVYFIAVIGAMFTTLYSVKVLYLTFITSPNGPLVSYKNAHEGDIFMSLPLIILALFSVFFGYICKDMFIGLGSGLFADNSLFIHPIHETMLNTEFAVSTFFKLLPFVITLVLSVLSIYVTEFLPKTIIHFKSTRLGYNIFSFFNLRFLVEFIYNRFITRIILNLGGQTTKTLDKGSVELIGPYGLENGILKLSESLSKLDTGVITSYALYILIALILYMLMPYVFYNDFSLLMLIVYALYIFSRTGSSLRVKSNTTSLPDGPKPKPKPKPMGVLLESSLLVMPSIIFSNINYKSLDIVNSKWHFYDKACFSCIYVAKLLLASTILRSFLFVLVFFLVFIGISYNVASAISIGLVWLLIFRSGLKSRNKVRYIIKFTFNVLIITICWFVIGKTLSVDLVYLILGNYVLFNLNDLNDIDLSDLINSFNIHDKCIGDPGGPNNNGPPNPNPYTLPPSNEGEDDSSGRRHRYEDLFNHHPGLIDYKNEVEYNNKVYKTSEIQKGIALYNEKIGPLSEIDEMSVKKSFFAYYFRDSNSIVRPSNFDCQDFISLWQHDMYNSILEYNTLKKAIAFHERSGTDLSIDYKNAFDIMQRQSIMVNTYCSVADLCSDKVLNTSCKINGHNPNIITQDFFDDEIAYAEIKKRFFSTQLHVLLSLDVYNKLQKEEIDFSNVDKGDLDAALLFHSKSFVDKHEKAYILKYKLLTDDINHKPEKSVNYLFEYAVKHRYKIGSLEDKYYRDLHDTDYGWYYKKILTNERDLKMVDRIVGYGPNNKKLVFNSYKDFVYMQKYYPKKNIFS